MNDVAPHVDGTIDSSRTETHPEPVVPRVVIRGPVDTAIIADATDRLLALAEIGRSRILSAELKLSMDPNRSSDRVATAEATIEVNGSPVRAHNVAPSMAEAITGMIDRMRRRLAHQRDKRESQRRRSTPPNWQWDGEGLRQTTVPYTAADADLVRRKSVPLEAISVDEALEDMDRMDHDFWLFVDRDLGSPRVVYRDSDGKATTSQPAASSNGDPELDGGDLLTGEMTLDDACAALDRDYVPFVFFREEESGVHQLLYRRHDGNYGLLLASDDH